MKTVLYLNVEEELEGFISHEYGSRRTLWGGRPIIHRNDCHATA